MTARSSSRVQNNLCRVFQVFRDPICATAIGHLVKAGAHADGAHAGVAPALGVDLLVSDKKRARKIDMVSARRFQNHARRGFAAFGWTLGNVGTKVTGIDQTGAKLTQDFLFDRAVLIEREKAATYSALIGNDDELVTFSFETAQCFRHALENTNLLRIGAVIGVVHDGAVAIDKDSATFLVTGNHAR